MEKTAKNTAQHRVFNLRLYTDMLRQLKLIGFVLGAITLIITLLPPLITFLNRLSSKSSAVPTLSVNEVVPILWGYMFVGGAGLVYAAFSFLNKRNASDYYHALPNTALATWLSVTAAVVTWLLGTVVANILFAYLACLITGISVSAFYIPYLLGYFAIGTLLVAAAASVAVCITGTRLTNLVLTGLILFVPRFITSVLALSIVSRTGIIDYSQTGIVFNPLYNIAAIPVNIPVNILVNASSIYSQSPIGFLPGMLYSGVLALVYFALALVFYRIRRSETAGMSAPSRLLQHIYRCVITLPLLIILPMNAYDSHESIFTFPFRNISTFVLILALSAIVYFTYELITTKKFKNILTTLPMFIALFVAAPIIAYYGTSVSAYAMLHNVPAVSSVSSINELSSKYNHSSDYRTLLLEDVDYDNPELISIVINALNRTVENTDKGYINFGDYYATFKINYGFSSITRTVYFTEDEYNRVNSLIQSSEAYIRASKQSLPLDREITSFTLENGKNDYDAARIWAVYKDEINALGPDKIDTALADMKYSFFGMSISVSGNRGFDIFHDTYYIGDLTPKTAEAYFDCFAEENGAEYHDLIAGIQSGADKYNYISFSINIFTPGNNGYQSFYSTNTGDDVYVKTDYDGSRDQAFAGLSVIKLFSSITSENDMQNVTLRSPFAYVIYTYSEPDGYDWKTGSVYIPITDEQLEAFTSGLEKLK